jgi:hypothetical protein
MRHIDPLENRQLLSTVVFNIDSDKSTIKVEAEVDIDNVGRFKLNAQRTGSDTARVQGTVRTDISSRGIRLLGGSRIDLATRNSSFSPGGKAADFAVTGKLRRLGITVYEVDAALRNLTLDLTTTSRLPANNNAIRLDRVTATVSSGTFDYDGSFNTDGSEDLRGRIGTFNDGVATFARSGSSLSASSARTFTIPVNLTIEREFDDYTVKAKLSGKIVANRA